MGIRLHDLDSMTVGAVLEMLVTRHEEIASVLTPAGTIVPPLPDIRGCNFYLIKQAVVSHLSYLEHLRAKIVAPAVGISP